MNPRQMVIWNITRLLAENIKPKITGGFSGPLAPETMACYIGADVITTIMTEDIELETFVTAFQGNVQRACAQAALDTIKFCVERKRNPELMQPDDELEDE